MQQESELRAHWRILVACFLGIALGLSSLYFYSLGIFIKPLAEEFGWTRGQASLGVLVGTICSAIVSVPFGRMVDKYGAVKVGLTSLLLLACSFLSLGQFTAGLTSFLLLTAILSLLTTGSTGLSFTRLIVINFEQQRGLALGIVLSGAGFGAILVPRILTPYVAEHGWRDGYFMLAATVLILLPIVFLALKGRETKPEISAQSEVPTTKLVFNPAFVTIACIFLAASISIIGTVVHFVPMLSDAGFSPVKAGTVASLIGVAAIAGRLVAGFMLDRFAAELVTAGLFLLAAVGLTILALGGSSTATIGALITGLAIGAEVDLMAFLTSRYFPQQVFGRTYGALYAIFLIGGAIGPALFGYLFDISDNYSNALFVGAALLVIAAATSVLLKRVSHVEI